MRPDYEDHSKQKESEGGAKYRGHLHGTDIPFYDVTKIYYMRVYSAKLSMACITRYTVFLGSNIYLVTNTFEPI